MPFRVKSTEGLQLLKKSATRKGWKRKIKGNLRNNYNAGFKSTYTEILNNLLGPEKAAVVLSKLWAGKQVAVEISKEEDLKVSAFLHNFFCIL